MSKIHGHKVPASVCEFFSTQERPVFKKRILQEISGLSVGMDIQCELRCLEQETVALMRIQDSDLAEFYKLQNGSSIENGKLDAGLCLCLGVNQNEDGLCLDYRESKTNPPVVLGASGRYNSECYIWKKVANTFSDFVARYNEG